MQDINRLYPILPTVSKTGWYVFQNCQRMTLRKSQTWASSRLNATLPRFCCSYLCQLGATVGDIESAFISLCGSSMGRENFALTHVSLPDTRLMPYAISFPLILKAVELPTVSLAHWSVVTLLDRTTVYYYCSVN
jgi:hypothetical protein